RCGAGDGEDQAESAYSVMHIASSFLRLPVCNQYIATAHTPQRHLYHLRNDKAYGNEASLPYAALLAFAVRLRLADVVDRVLLALVGGVCCRGNCVKRFLLLLELYLCRNQFRLLLQALLHYRLNLADRVPAAQSAHQAAR